MTKSAMELFSFQNLVDCPHATINDLKNLYLFYGGICDKQWLENLISEYKGKIYHYHEYQNIVKNIPY